MARIGATLSGTERMLLNRLAEANAAVTLHTLRLATEQDVNSPRDNPAAFITLSRFQRDLNVVAAVMSNTTAAGSLIGQTQTTLGEVRDQLETIQTQLLRDEDRSLTPSERADAQAQIDQAIDAVNQLASTSLDGRRTLDGSADFHASGLQSDEVLDLRVYSLGGAASRTISGTVTQAATQAQLFYSGTGGNVTADATFILAGNLGEAEISVTEGETLAAAAQRINDQSHNTGVTAAVDGNQMTLSSVTYGSRAEVAVVGTFPVTGGHGDGTANGTDAAAVINGQTYAAGDGNRFTVNQNGLRFEIEFQPEFSGGFQEITVSGNALKFSLSTDLVHTSTLAIPGVQAARLGGLSGRLDQIASGGAYSGLDGNTSRALRIVGEALADLDRIEGSVAGFYNASVTTSSDLLADLQDTLEESRAQTDGFDENEETILLAKSEQLVSNSLASLTVLGQQRAAMVEIIKHIAGLT